MNLTALWTSIEITFWATLWASLAGILMAYLVYSYFGKFKNFINSICTIPLVLPPTVVGFIIFWSFYQKSPAGSLLKHSKVSSQSSLHALIIASAIVAFPWMYTKVLEGFKEIELEIVEAAKTLGASKNRLFWQVLLPLSLPAIFSGLILTASRALGEFAATFLITANVQDGTQTIPMVIYFLTGKGLLQDALFWVFLMVLTAICAVFLLDNVKKISPINPLSSLIGYWLVINSGNQKEIYTPQTTGLAVEISQLLPRFNLQIAFNTERKVIGLLGNKGLGNYLTIRSLAGLEPKTQGHILLNGKVLLDSQTRLNVPPHKRPIAMVFKKYALFPHLTVTENIAFGLQKLTREARTEEIAFYVTIFKLEGYEKLYPEQLSNVEKQRLAFARAIATQPEVLLLDEPFFDLDSYGQEQGSNALARAMRDYAGITLITSNRIDTLYPLCERLLVISEGLILHDGSREKVFQHPLAYTVAQLTGCQNITRYQYVDRHTVKALDWNCLLTIHENPEATTGYIGIRANHIIFVPNTVSTKENIFPCWLLSFHTSPEYITLHVRLNAALSEAQDQTIEVRVDKKLWEALQTHPQPWQVFLNTQHLMILKTL